MKLPLLVTMLVANLLTGGVAPAAPATPKIQFDQMVYNFGGTSLVQQLTGRFIISNTGTAPLTLEKPSPSCGCTVATLQTNQLAHGETAELNFTVTVTSGTIEKYILISSNDPVTPQVKLAIKANILPVFDFSPQYVDFHNIHIGGTTNIAIQITRLDGKPLGIHIVETDAPFIHTGLTMVAGTNNAAIVRIEVSAVGVARRFNNAVNLLSETNSRPLLIIPVSGRIVGDIVLEPMQLGWHIRDPENWPGLAGIDATTRRVRVSPGTSDFHFGVNNLTCSLPDLKVTANPLPDGQFEIVAVLGKVPAESGSGVIRFETNSPRQPVVEISVIISINRHN